MLTNLNITGLKVEMARESNRHVKKTLPPSLNGFPGMADIKYYIKATIIRPQFYKENIRAVCLISINSLFDCVLTIVTDHAVELSSY